MKLLSFFHENTVKYGAIETDGTIFVLSELLSTQYPELRDVLGSESFLDTCGTAKNASPTLGLDEVRLLPPIPYSNKIFCVGLNYLDHQDETGHAPTAYPTIFSRFSDSQCAHGSPMMMPECSTEFDFEAELAVVIGRPAYKVSESDALKHVAGYSCYNDGSIRDWQVHSTQFLPGKNFPNTGAFGPYLVTYDEIDDPQNLKIDCRLNGQSVQSATTGLMIHSIARTISYISQFSPLGAGDVIATGTPGGVGFTRTPPLFMKSGDVVEVEIENIGILRNEIVGP